MSRNQLILKKLGSKYYTNEEFVSLWNQWIESAYERIDFTCSCGTTLHPSLYNYETNELTSPVWYILAERLYKHMNTNKHNKNI